MNKHQPAIIGLTGRMGTGKSTVARYMARQWNIPVYHADDRAKELMNENVELKEKIRAFFGPESYQNGRLNTAYLGRRVFAHPDELARLEALVHPVVREDFRRWYQQQKDAPYVLLENAILKKSGMDRMCDAIVVVEAPEEAIIRRVKARNGWTENHIRQRLSQQKAEPFEDVKTFYINNSKDFNDLERQLKGLHESLLKFQ